MRPAPLARASVPLARVVRRTPATKPIAAPEMNAEFESLTPAVREGTIPWSTNGVRQAIRVVRAVRSGELRVTPEALGVPEELIARADLDDVALGLWLRRRHARDSLEVPAAHHIRFHAIEGFLHRHAELLVDEGLVREGETGIEPDPLLLAELADRPYDIPLEGDTAPTFDAVEVLKAVARRARGEAEPTRAD